MITFDTNIPVRLDGKIVGHIKSNDEGNYYYKPKSGARGEVMPTITQVKRSLLKEDEVKPMINTKTCITIQGNGIHVMVCDFSAKGGFERQDLNHTNTSPIDNTCIDWTLVQDLIEKTNNKLSYE